VICKQKDVCWASVDRKTKLEAVTRGDGAIREELLAKVCKILYWEGGRGKKYVWQLPCVAEHIPSTTLIQPFFHFMDRKNTLAPQNLSFLLRITILYKSALASVKTSI
jgi:hypothetical protein